MTKDSAKLNVLQTKANTSSDTPLLDTIIDSIQDIKGKNVVKVDLRSIDDAATNYFVICEGESTTQIKAIANNISRRVKSELQLSPSHTEGTQDSRWMLVDYFDVVVHIFYPEARRYYDLEDLWSDGVITEYEDV